MHYLFVFLGACALVLTLLTIVRRFVTKTPTFPAAFLGGVVLYMCLTGVVLYVALATPYLLERSIQLKHVIGITLAGGILMIGGYLNDMYNWKPRWQSMFAILAVIIVIASGIGIRQMTNPFGGIISLVWWEKTLFWWQGIGYRLTLPADLFTFFWLLLLTSTTKFLDRLDGLVSGMTVIGALMIFFLATATKYVQPEVGMFAMIVAGAFLGFFIWNWTLANMFLGTGGSMVAGFFLGTLAIISGGKIATALLVLGVPVCDAGWAMIRRVVWQRQLSTSPTHSHLPSRLLDVGFSSRDVVVLLLTVSAVFGATTLFLQSAQKLLALLFISLLTAFFMGIGSVTAPLSLDERRGIRRRTILGVSVDSTTYKDALAHVEALIQKGGQHLITTPNPEMLVLAQQDPEFRAILNQASLAIPDGIGLMLAARWLKKPLATRISGSDFVWELARFAAERGFRMQLVGAGEGVAASAAEKLQARNPQLKIVTENPDILLVALGHGKQEKWIVEHFPGIPTVKVAMGVGGTFDFIAKEVWRAPRIVRLLGLEWFWRFLCQPWRLPRMWRAVIVFPWLVVRDFYQGNVRK